MVALDGQAFEDEVRRVARSLWPYARHSGAVNLDGKERDGVFETEEAIHVLECTTWATKDKAQKDLEKIRAAIRKLQRADKPAVGWFVTSREPTADQRGLLRPGEPIRMMSFEQFRSKLIDSMAYLQLRDDYPFGSARDPQSGGIKAPERYVPIRLTVDAPNVRTITVTEIVAEVSEGSRFLLLGDYGAGKSMTLRQIHRALASEARKGRSIRFPLHVNLRDHQGQVDPVEVLERHARRLGFPTPTQLVRAWRAGQVHLLLDGFDEIATMGWQGPTKNLRQIRRRSVSAVRDFVKESPAETGIVVAGREHFFESRSEMLAAFDATLGFQSVRLADFSTDQVGDYLADLGWNQDVPGWVPARPLLLAYLANRGLLQDVLESAEGTPPAVAWDDLLDRICEREAQIEAGIDSHTVRRILERLATLARRSSSGIGPVFFDDVERAFREVVGYPPDEAAMVLLQRLPGLGAPDPQDQSSRFVDEQLVDAARAGDVVAYVQNPYADGAAGDRDWVQLLGTLGVEVAAVRMMSDQHLLDNVAVALGRLARSVEGHSPLAADLVRVMAELGAPQALKEPTYIESVVVPGFSWTGEGADLRLANFRDCVIEHLELPRDGDADVQLPYFERCMIGAVEGRMSERDLPAEHFIECEISDYVDATLTTGGIMAMSLPKGTRVVLTVLKKLYRQRGSARKESALLRGLDLGDRELVGPVLDLLQREGLAVRTRAGGQRVWAPVRKNGARVSAILDSPATSGGDDPVLVAAAKLASS